MEQGELISVIIPVYNTELYLRKCLDSVIGQTYGNLEIIVIDDGSTDSSGRICDEYARRDKRVFVKHQPDLGVAVTRNIALSMCKGSYITFVDSDDYISPDMIELLYQTLISEDADMSCCGNCDVGFEGDLVPFHLPEYKMVYTDNTEFLYDVIIFKIRLEVWAKLFKASLFQKIKFDEKIKRAEDFVFWLDAYPYLQKVVSIDEKKYFRVIRTGSIMSFREFDSNLLTWIIYSRDKALLTFNTLGERFIKMGQGMCLGGRMWYLKDVFKYGQEAKHWTEIEKIREYYRKYWRWVLNTTFLTTKEKILCFLLIFSPTVFGVCYRYHLKRKQGQ